MRLKIENSGSDQEERNRAVIIGLRDSERFVEIQSGDKQYYGGNQAWYEWEGDQRKEAVARKAGCGTVAAANIAAYLAGCDPKYGGLYPYLDYSKKNYLLHMKERYRYVKPFHIGEIPLGVWPVERMANGVKRYARSRGVKLSAVWHHGFFNRKNVIRYIAEGLGKDSPVAMLVGLGRLRKARVTYCDGRNAMEKMSLHLVTVTELRIHERENTARVKASTWGGWTELDLDDYLDEWIYEGLLYFQ